MKSSMETVNNAVLLFLLLHLLFVIRILEHSRHFLQKTAEKKMVCMKSCTFRRLLKQQRRGIAL